MGVGASRCEWVFSLVGAGNSVLLPCPCVGALAGDDLCCFGGLVLVFCRFARARQSRFPGKQGRERGGM